MTITIMNIMIRNYNIVCALCIPFVIMRFVVGRLQMIWTWHKNLNGLIDSFILQFSALCVVIYPKFQIVLTIDNFVKTRCMHWSFWWCMQPDTRMIMHDDEFSAFICLSAFYSNFTCILKLWHFYYSFVFVLHILGIQWPNILHNTT